MGGSGSTFGSVGITVEKDRCGEDFYFHVVIITNTEQSVWNHCKENDDVYIKINQMPSEFLPRLEVRRMLDDFVIGLVPATSTGIINCIKAGWNYPGTIQKKSGTQFAPEIFIHVKGDR